MVNRMDVIPYAPSARWYASWLRNLSGSSPESGVAVANAALRLGGKDFARTLIAGNNGNQMLSIAVEGGASRLKRDSFVACATLSDHGNWRRVHAGALEASYGKAPYYPHLMPLLKEVYENPELTRLRDFNAAIHKVILEMLLPAAGSFTLSAWVGTNETVRRRGEEVAAGIDPDLSVIDSLMRFGPETLLALSII